MSFDHVSPNSWRQSEVRLQTAHLCDPACICASRNACGRCTNLLRMPGTPFPPSGGGRHVSSCRDKPDFRKLANKSHARPCGHQRLADGCRPPCKRMLARSCERWWWRRPDQSAWMPQAQTVPSNISVRRQAEAAESNPRAIACCAAGLTGTIPAAKKRRLPLRGSADTLGASADPLGGSAPPHP